MNLSSKELRKEDLLNLDEIASLYKDLGYPSTNEKLKDRLNQIIEHKDYSFLLLIMDDKIVGFSGLCKMLLFEKNGYYMRILAFVVSSKYRNQGLGSFLLKESEDFARIKNCHTIALNSGMRSERKRAHQFYLKNSYEIKSTGFLKELFW